MESAPEEHSSQHLPVVQSNPDFTNQRTSLDSRPDSAPAETSAQDNSAEAEAGAQNFESRKGGLSTLKESEEASSKLDGASRGQRTPKAALSGGAAASNDVGGGQTADIDDLSSAADMVKARGDPVSKVKTYLCWHGTQIVGARGKMLLQFNMASFFQSCCIHTHVARLGKLSCSGSTKDLTIDTPNPVLSDVSPEFVGLL